MPCSASRKERKEGRKEGRKKSDRAETRGGKKKLLTRAEVFIEKCGYFQPTIWQGVSLDSPSPLISHVPASFQSQSKPRGQEAREVQPLDVSILEPRGRRESMKDGSEGAGGEL